MVSLVFFGKKKDKMMENLKGIERLNNGYTIKYQEEIM
jgi:hypothetical protein